MRFSIRTLQEAMHLAYGSGDEDRRGKPILVLNMKYLQRFVSLHTSVSCRRMTKGECPRRLAVGAYGNGLRGRDKLVVTIDLRSAARMGAGPRWFGGPGTSVPKPERGCGDGRSPDFHKSGVTQIGSKRE